jgi:hypothetical protein
MQLAESCANRAQRWPPWRIATESWSRHREEVFKRREDVGNWQQKRPSGDEVLSSRLPAVGVDAPESGQPFCSVCKDHLAKRAFGKEAIADCYKVDKY